MKKAIAAILSIAAIALPQSAIAVPVVSRDLEGTITVSNSGHSPGTLLQIRYSLMPVSTIVKTSGACNLLTIKRSSKFMIDEQITIGSTVLPISRYITPSLVGLPCINGVINPAYPWQTSGIYKYVQDRPNGGLTIIVSGAVGSVKVDADPGKNRLVKTDSCGRIVVRPSEKWKVADIGSTFSYYASGGYWTDIPLPVAVSTAFPYICYKKILYKPL